MVSAECLATMDRKLKRAHRVSLLAGGRSCIKCWRASNCNLRFLISGILVNYMSGSVRFLVCK